jgi:hypothetical protein
MSYVSNKKFQIPEQVLWQMEEFCKGGFILFRFDEDENPEIISRFDSQAYATSMQYYLQNWCDAIKALNLGVTTSSIIGQNRKKRKGE